MSTIQTKEINTTISPKLTLKASLTVPEWLQGEAGSSGVWVGSEAPPADEEYNVWIDPSGSETDLSDFATVDYVDEAVEKVEISGGIWVGEDTPPKDTYVVWIDPDGQSDDSELDERIRKIVQEELAKLTGEANA